MLVELLRPNYEHSDDRGKLVQLIREGYKQINVIESKAGSFRGGHYHNFNREAFYIIRGGVRLTVCKDGESETHDFKPGDMFVIPAGVTHDFLFLSDTVLVSMYENGVELKDGKMDILHA